MDGMATGGIPWLEYPLSLHSPRNYKCKLKTQEQCEYQQGYWRFWYEADHRYALPTVAFFLATIVLFALAHLLPLPPNSKCLRRLTAFARFLSYRTFRLSKLDWNSAPLGILLLGLAATIYFSCMTFAPEPYYWPSDGQSWGESPPLGTRSGWLSLACLPFLIATASKANLISLLTGVSHEKLQVFHRWIAYAFFVTALLHTFPFIVFNIRSGTMREEWRTSVEYWTGVAALVAQAWLTCASWGPIRERAYEWFKFLHYTAGVVFVVFFFIHCGGTLSSWDYFIATGVLFATGWLYRHLRIYAEHGVGLKATVTLMENGFVKVGVPTTATWAVGQHFFLRFIGLGPVHALATHPFTACSLPSRTACKEGAKNELVFYIRPRGGFTARLAKHAGQHPNAELHVLLDGPYGGVHTAQVVKSDRSLVLAGGSGAGWTLPFLIAYFRRLESGQEKGLSMRLVLATRDLATRRWFEEALVSVLSQFGLSSAPPGLEIEVYYTGTEEGAASVTTTTGAQFPDKLDDPEKAPLSHPVIETTLTASSSSSEDIKAAATRPTETATSNFSHGRPNLPALVASEVAAVGPDVSMGIFVCGPLSMQNDVANAVARPQLDIAKDGNKDVYLHMEHFSWA